MKNLTVWLVTLMACTDAVVEDAPASTIGGKADGIAGERIAPLRGWGRVPDQGVSEAWLVPGEVVLRYTREQRDGLDPLGLGNAGCNSVVATNATVYVLDRLGATSFELAVANNIQFSTGGGTRANTSFQDLAFGAFTRPVTGETGRAASVPEFIVIGNCQGQDFLFTQRVTFSRTFADGSVDARPTASANLAEVMSLELEAPLATSHACEAVGANMPLGVQLQRCVGARDAARAFDQLRVVLRTDYLPERGQPLVRQQYDLWVSLNGVDVTVPMACVSYQSYPSNNWVCTATIVNQPQPGLLFTESPQVVPSLFEFARRDASTVVNAWDVELAAVSQDGRWLNAPGGGNFSARFDEVVPR
jgi:hypothetical protein